jgi:hypothetical protein
MGDEPPPTNDWPFVALIVGIPVVAVARAYFDGWWWKRRRRK